VCDRPFAFLLRDRQTGLVLFSGRVTDPSVGEAAPRSIGHRIHYGGYGAAPEAKAKVFTVVAAVLAAAIARYL
jgi:hypothetical protein